MADPSDGLVLERADPPARNWPKAGISPIPGPIRVETFVSPDCSYAALRDLIAAAQQELRLYIYNVSAEHMLDLLRDARDRGVEVSIMYDRTDTRSREEERLAELGVNLHIAPSAAPRRAFTVCHQKFLVLDRKTVVLGSANWATTSVPKIDDPATGKWKKGNREWLIALHSRKAAKRFLDLFELDRDWTPLEEMVAAELPELAPSATSPFEEAPPANRLQIEQFDLDSDAEVIPLLSPQNYFEAVRKIIRGAKKSILVEQQYIKTAGEGMFVEELLDAVRERYKEADVDVRFLTSCAFPKHWIESAATLSGLGLKRRLRAINPSTFTHCHNKGVIVDGKHTVISSTNWSDNSIGAAREAGVLISDDAIAGYYTRAFDIDWDEGLSPTEVEQRLNREIVTDPRTELEIHPADLR